MRGAMLGLAGLMSLSGASFAAVLATEDQICQAIAGNTISGTEDGKPYTEYFLPDGSLRGVGPEGPYSGEWRINGRELCERSFAQRDDEAASQRGLAQRLGMHGRRDHRLWFRLGRRRRALRSPPPPRKSKQVVGAALPQPEAEQSGAVGPRRSKLHAAHYRVPAVEVVPDPALGAWPSARCLTYAAIGSLRRRRGRRGGARRRGRSVRGRDRGWSQTGGRLLVGRPLGSWLALDCVLRNRGLRSFARGQALLRSGRDRHDRRPVWRRRACLTRAAIRSLR